MRDIVAVIRSSRGRNAVRRGLCYDAHHLWRVPVVVTLPETRPGVLRGKRDQWARTVPHPPCAYSPALWDRATSVSLNKLFGVHGKMQVSMRLI
jgi:hypothetical protein